LSSRQTDAVARATNPKKESGIIYNLIADPCNLYPSFILEL